MNSTSERVTLHADEPSLLAVLTASRRWRLALLLVWFVGGALYFALPPSPDQFNHGYLGWRLWSGDVPYVDTVDMNWPGVMGLQAVAVALFGTTLWAWRAVDLVLFAFAAAALADLLRQADGARTARMFALLCLPLYIAFGYWMAGQHDMTAAQFLAMALWCHVQADRADRVAGARAAEARADVGGGWRWAAAAGALVGVAILNKPTVGTLLVWWPLQGLWLLRPWKAAGVWAVAVRAMLAGAASVATVALAFGGVLALGTPWQELVDVVFTFNAVSRLDEPVPWVDVASRIGWWPLGVILYVVPGLMALGRPAWRSAPATSIVLLALTGLVSFAAQRRGLHYHLAPFVLCGMCLMAVIAERGLRWWRTTRPRAGGFGAFAAVLGLGLALGLGLRIGQTYRGLPSAIAAGDWGVHLAHFRENDGLTVADAWRFARSLDGQPPHACVLVVGTSSAVNFLAARPQSTRFYYFPVISAMKPAMPMADRWVGRWEQDLAGSRCHDVLVAARVWLHEDHPGPKRAAEALQRHLESHYTRVGELGDRGMVHYVRRVD